MTIGHVRLDDDGSVSASGVEWRQTPELRYALTMTSTGELVRLEVDAVEGARVSPRRLREAPIGTMQRQVRAMVASMVVALEKNPAVELVLDDDGRVVRDASGDIVTRESTAEALDALAQWRKRYARLARRFGNAGPADRALTVAALYVRLLDEGEAKPIPRIADQLNLSDKTIRNYLFKARERGLLTSAGPGRAGGALTPQALALIEEA